MISKRQSLLFVATLLGFAAWSANVGISADEPAKDGEKNAKSISEQDIYIPYEKLRQVFEKHGRGVFLPYEKFQELWQAAQDKNRPAAEIKPPVGSLITEIDNTATVEKDVVSVKAKLKIEVLAEGWTEIPLRLSDAAITSATLAGRPARIIGGQGQDYRLLIEKKGKQAESMELSLEYARAISRSPGQNSVSFQSPQAPVSRWRVTIPQAGVKVNIHPLIAATEVPTEKKGEGDAAKKADETVVLAFVGAAPTVSIDWTPKSEGATGLAAVASVQANQQVWITEGAVRTRALLTYAISRAELAKLIVDVPTDQKVVNVFDANVRGWSVETVDGSQRITAQLFEPAKTSQQVTVELEKFTGEKGEKSGKGEKNEKGDQIVLPTVKAGGVGRQQGTLVVHVAESLRAEAVKTSGLMQVDAAELPQGLQGGKWAFAYRYAAVPFELTLGVEKLQPQITVDSLVEAALLPDRLTLDLTAVYTIEKAGVFRLDLDVPAGFEVRQVRGASVAGAAAVQVDNHYLEGEKKTRLVVNLTHKAIGRAALWVQLEKNLQQPELLTPTGKSAQLPLTVPLVPPRTAEKATGRIVISAPESLRVNPEKTTGLRVVSFAEAYDGIKATSRPQPNQPRPVLAFAFSGEEPIVLSISAERRKPHVAVRQLLVARVEDGVVKYDFTFFYDVRYSGVKSLRIDVPKDVAEQLRVTTPGFHEKTIEPPPAKLSNDDVAWSLSGDTELFGSGKIELNWEKKIENLEIGKPIELTLPHLKPRDVDRAWGQIVLVKSETIDVHESGEPKSLRPIDPQHDLMNPVASAARAFEFYDDWTLGVVATRYELEEIKRSSIERAMVRMVVTPAQKISVQALYRMLSTRQRVVVELPAGAEFDSQPLRVNGRPASLEKGGKNEYYVPLAAAKADVPFVVELRYTLPGDGARLQLPAFPEEPAVVKAYLAVYLPETRTLLATRGPWNEEFRWCRDPSLQWRASPTTDPKILADQIREGIVAAGNAADDFQTDGRLYLYSTLRPADGEAGSLEATIIDARWLHGLVFGITVLLGLLLLPARLPTRAFVVGLAVIGLVLSGVFLPTFSHQVLGGVLLSAVFIVAVLWTLAFVSRRKKPPMPVASASTPPAVGELGVDLSQYSPEPAVVEPPKPNDQEGGQNNA